MNSVAFRPHPDYVRNAGAGNEQEGMAKKGGGGIMQD